MNEHQVQKEENQKVEELGEPVVTNLWDDSDSEEMTHRNESKEISPQKSNQIDTFMVVKKKRTNLDSSPFTMNDNDQVFQIEMTPSGFEE